MFLLGALSLMFVAYASLLPLRYVACDFEVALSRFRNIRWLNLPIERRADWVANGLIMLPSGFLLAGGIDWGRSKRWSLILATPIIIATMSVTMLVVEFAQLWFPPRVVSQNDLLAEFLGSIAGVACWWLAGRRIVAGLIASFHAPPGIERWYALSQLSVLGLLLYSLLPF